MGRQSEVRRAQAQVQRERLARARAEGVAEGLQQALQLLLGGTGPRRKLRKPRRAVRRVATRAAAVKKSAPSAPPKARAAAPARVRPSPADKRAPRPAPAAAPVAEPRRARTRRAASARAAAGSQRARPRPTRRPRAALPAPPPAAPEATPGGLSTLLSGPPAAALEAALARVLVSKPGSVREKSSSEEVVLRMRPWVVGVARAVYSSQRTELATEEELVQEGLVAVHACCRLRRFKPGRAGKGRTLFPAYALKAARQGMSRLLQQRRSVVQLTSWGRKTRTKAVRRAEKEKVPLAEALLAEGAAPLMVPALERGVVEVASLSGPVLRKEEDPGERGLQSTALFTASQEAAEEQQEHQAKLQLGEAAMAALSLLAPAQRQVVVGMLGLEGPATPARVLARRMSLEPAEVERLYAEGLVELRGELEA